MAFRTLFTHRKMKKRKPNEKNQLNNAFLIYKHFLMACRFRFETHSQRPLLNRRSTHVATKYAYVYRMRYTVWSIIRLPCDFGYCVCQMAWQQPNRQNGVSEYLGMSMRIVWQNRTPKTKPISEIHNSQSMGKGTTTKTTTTKITTNL